MADYFHYFQEVRCFLELSRDPQKRRVVVVLMDLDVRRQKSETEERYQVLVENVLSF